jgi:hypothetical protein
MNNYGETIRNALELILTENPKTMGKWQQVSMIYEEMEVALYGRNYPPNQNPSPDWFRSTKSLGHYMSKNLDELKDWAKGLGFLMEQRHNHCNVHEYIFLPLA